MAVGLHHPSLPGNLIITDRNLLFSGAAAKGGLELEKGKFELTDAMQQVLMGEQQLVCRASVREGKVRWTHRRMAVHTNF